MNETAKLHQDADKACGIEWAGSGCTCSACHIERKRMVLLGTDLIERKKLKRGIKAVENWIKRLTTQ